MSEAPPRRRLGIERHGPGLLQIGGTAYRHPVLVLPDAVHDWTVTDFAVADAASLSAILAAGDAVEFAVLGCGVRMQPLGRDLKAAFSAARIGVETMDTPAACRTFNVLLAEGRRAAAALIPV